MGESILYTPKGFYIGWWSKTKKNDHIMKNYVSINPNKDGL